MIGVREIKKQQTRQAILTAAITLFSDKGFDATSIEDIAGAAGIGKATIYGYFSTKDQMFIHYCDEKLIQAFGQLKQDDSRSLPLLEQLVGFFMMKFNFVTENREFGRHLLREMIFPKEVTEQVKDHDRRYFAILEDVFQAAMKRGEISHGQDLFLLSAHFFSIYLGLFAGWYNGYFTSQVEIEKNMRILFRQALDGVSS